MNSRSVLLTLLFALPLVAEETNIHWHFTVDEGFSERDRNALHHAGWSVNDYAARPHGLKIITSPAYPANGSLEMWGDPAGIPAATLSFKPLADGELMARLGVQGKENQHARLELMSDDTVLAGIGLINKSIGQFISGAGIKGFQDTESWDRNTRLFSLTWSGAAADKAGTVSFRFEPVGKGAEPVTVKSVAFAAPGIPNRMRLRVGIHPGDGKRGLILDELSIHGK
jgi:hypothetical protein